MPDPIRLSQSTATTRRTVLRAAGLAALTSSGVAALAACSPVEEEAAAPTTSPASSAPATSAPATSEAPTEASPTESETEEVPSGPSVATSEVPVGGGVILEDADFVITQPKAGEFKAFSKICTHMQCPVGSVEGGTINCPCHGSKYSIEDGSVVKPPAPDPLAEAEVTVSGDRVVVTG
jgi:Rieske Fe-S protein